MRVAVVHADFASDLECSVPPELAIQVESECLFDMDGVLEYGRVVKVNECSCGGSCSGEKPRIVRRATLQDQAKEKENILRGRMAKGRCAEVIGKHKLPMRIISVSYSFDRSVLRILFSSDERVDFRQMMKDLSSELDVRVDIRQLGVRDEAAIIGGVATCGRTMCCCSWLKDFESINVKMAKTQNLSLNPGAISGMCGRLKCCLKYEYDAYVEQARAMPREGRRVACEDGEGIIIDRNILCSTVKVRFDDERVKEYSVKDIELT